MPKKQQKKKKNKEKKRQKRKRKNKDKKVHSYQEGPSTMRNNFHHA